MRKGHANQPKNSLFFLSECLAARYYFFQSTVVRIARIFALETGTECPVL